MDFKLDKTLKDIITVSINLHNLFEVLSDSKFQEDENKFETQLEYIKLVAEYETKLYNNTNWKKELKDNPLTFNRFSYLLRRYDLPDKTKKLISIRFKNYISSLLNKNPFRSNSQFIKQQELENSNVIFFQINKDIDITTLYYLNKDINKEKDPTIKQELINLYYEAIFKQNILQEFLKTPPQEIETRGREICSIFNQDKELITQIYQTVILNRLYKVGNIILSYTDEMLREKKEYIGKEKFLLNVIKATIIQETKEEQELIELNLNPEIKKISSQSYDNLMTTIKEAELSMNKNNKQKKKSPNN